MPENPQDHLRRVGRQLKAARDRLAESRADFGRAAGISERSLARLESGKDVRLSTYLAVIRHLAVHHSTVAGLTERVLQLPEVAQARVLAVIERFERIDAE